MPLTDVRIRAARPSVKPQKLSDGGGLQLHVSPGGARTWFLAFRHDGKQRKMRIGAYPGVGLAEARAEREKAKGLLDRGLDPISHRKHSEAEEKAAAAVTFAVAAQALIDRKRDEGLADDTVAKAVWLISFMTDAIGARPIREVKPAEVLAVLKTMEARGRRDSAKRLRALTSSAFRLAIANQQCDHDPAAPLVGALAAPIVKNRAAIIEPQGVGELLRAVDGYAGQFVTRCALQLLALTALRPGELRQGRWEEVDLEGASWTIPGSRMKGRKAHKIPLSQQSVQILREMRIYQRGDLIFQGNGKSRSTLQEFKPLPISENTLNVALRRMGFTKDQMTAHGFRAVFSTLAAESHLWSVDVIEAQLAHQDPNQIRRIYQRSTFWDERVKLVQWWADECDRPRKLKPPRAV